MDRHNKPLAGKRIVVTRAPEQARDLTDALEHLGAKVISLPMVSFASPEDCQKLDEQLRRLNDFDAIVFLSSNAVRYIFDRCAQLGIKCEMLQSLNRLIVAVGPATAQALTGKGIKVGFVSQSGTGEGLAHELRGSLAGRRVLLPRSDRGDEQAPNALRAAGAVVTEVIAYRTVKPASLDREILAGILRGDMNSVIFASPSAYKNFQSSVGDSALQDLSHRVDFAAIGPTTAAAIQNSGARVAIQAEEASADGLARAIADYYSHPQATARRV